MSHLDIRNDKLILCVHDGAVDPLLDLAPIVMGMHSFRSVRITCPDIPSDPAQRLLVMVRDACLRQPRIVYIAIESDVAAWFDAEAWTEALWPCVRARLYVSEEIATQPKLDHIRHVHSIDIHPIGSSAWSHTIVETILQAPWTHLNHVNLIFEEAINPYLLPSIVRHIPPSTVHLYVCFEDSLDDIFRTIFWLLVFLNAVSQTSIQRLHIDSRKPIPCRSADAADLVNAINRTHIEKLYLSLNVPFEDREVVRLLLCETRLTRLLGIGTDQEPSWLDDPARLVDWIAASHLTSSPFTCHNVQTRIAWNRRSLRHLWSPKTHAQFMKHMCRRIKTLFVLARTDRMHTRLILAPMHIQTLSNSILARIAVHMCASFPRDVIAETRRVFA